MQESDVKLRLGVMLGSLRKASFNAALGRSLATYAPSNTRIDLLPSIGMLPHYNQDILDEGIPEALAQLAEAIRAVDGVIIVSPEYNWSMPGVLKNALDWLSRLNPGPLQDKPVTLFTSSPGLLGGARAHAPIRNVLLALDCKVLVKPEVQISQIKAKLSADTPTITDAATADFVTQRLAAFSDFARRG
ncbi:NADPH-dependent FMN reductase [Frigidibacter sp.]|uniref:NADPH-dependent FMN reductase n=1 Tax=Frigidibacter sp. TaxID=2586418 RepID=UPI0027358415|nr:NADPH-dependent FMN reductase [Frigidibacter sp.]MDP3342202.1 NADPH-dependent FMN reductase [Frigidibacter sp.]